MAGARRFAAGGAVALAFGLSACAPSPGPGDLPRDGALRIRFEEALAPGAFAREAAARVAAPGAAPGFWAEVDGLPRPERALVENLATGAEVRVALFRGCADCGGAIRLSDAAAQALGIGGEPARVRVTALRREPRIDAP